MLGILPVVYYEENPDVNKSKYLKFSAYMALTDDISHSASMRRVRELGFQTTMIL